MKNETGSVFRVGCSGVWNALNNLVFKVSRRVRPTIIHIGNTLGVKLE